MPLAIYRAAVTVGAYFRTPVGIASEPDKRAILAWPLYGSGRAPCDPIRISAPKTDSSNDGRWM